MSLSAKTRDQHVQRARRAVRSICCTNYVVHDEAELPMRLDEKCAINLNILVGGSNVAWRQLKEKEEAIQLTAAIRPGALRQLIGWSHALVNRKRRVPRDRRSSSISPFARRPGLPDSRETSLKAACRNRRKGDDLPQVPQSPALATCPLSSVACGVLCGVSGVSNALWLWGK